MIYETFYDAGLKPFRRDKYRGKWASPMDFFFTCIGHGFKIDTMFVIPSLLFQSLGFKFLIPYFTIMCVCTMPIVFMQLFLGQFSSTGFISVFRIAPIFKGVGYVALAINITMLTYYSIFAAIPLFYFLHSLRPTLPWSCEANQEWLQYDGNMTLACNVTAMELPSVEFFRQNLNLVNTKNDRIFEVTYSWPLIICTFDVWVVVWLVLKNSTKTIGRVIRYFTMVTIGALIICVLRFSFLPGAFNGLDKFFDVSLERIMQDESIGLIALLALSGLGPGWGSILTMASYNEFKTDVTKPTRILCLSQFGLMLLASFSWTFIYNFLIDANKNVHIHRHSSQWVQLISIPSALSSMEMPNLWSLLFFGMLTLGAITLLIVQLFSVLTSLFDEYEQLRRYRHTLIRITIPVLALVSTFFCSNNGVLFFELMTKYSVLTQMLLNLILLLVVFWVYGRKPFLCDLYFMTKGTYSTWMANKARFIAPITLLFTSLIALALTLFESEYSATMFGLVSFIILAPWLLIPGYCIYKVMQTGGSFKRRFKSGARPTDWYPADPADRQRYEETFGTPEIPHQWTIDVDDWIANADADLEACDNGRRTPQNCDSFRSKHSLLE